MRSIVMFGSATIFMYCINNKLWFKLANTRIIAELEIQPHIKNMFKSGWDVRIDKYRHLFTAQSKIAQLFHRQYENWKNGI